MKREKEKEKRKKRKKDRELKEIIESNRIIPLVEYVTGKEKYKNVLKYIVFNEHWKSLKYPFVEDFDNQFYFDFRGRWKKIYLFEWGKKYKLLGEYSREDINSEKFINDLFKLRQSVKIGIAVKYINYDDEIEEKKKEKKDLEKMQKERMNKIDEDILKAEKKVKETRFWDDWLRRGPRNKLDYLKRDKNKIIEKNKQEILKFEEEMKEIEEKIDETFMKITLTEDERYEFIKDKNHAPRDQKEIREWLEDKREVIISKNLLNKKEIEMFIKEKGYFPTDPHEIDNFIKRIRLTSNKLTEDEVELYLDEMDEYPSDEEDIEDWKSDEKLVKGLMTIREAKLYEKEKNVYPSDEEDIKKWLRRKKKMFFPRKFELPEIIEKSDDEMKDEGEEEEIKGVYNKDNILLKINLLANM